MNTEQLDKKDESTPTNADARARRRRFGFVLIAIVAATICLLGRDASNAKAPRNFQTLEEKPTLYPDYVETTLPINLAPTNFRVEEEGAAYVTRFSVDGYEFGVSGRDVKIPEVKWRKALKLGVGKTLKIDVYVKTASGWNKYQTFENEISPDPIDPFVAYRLIEPGYEFGHRIVLAQRSLESFDERRFVDNRALATSPCVNCHSFQDRKTERFLFHYRRADDSSKGGTVFVDGKKARKVSAKLESLDASCAYPAWRPSGDFVVFSANKTRQIFHSLSSQKIEVFDADSDLVLFDSAKNELKAITQTNDQFETFPSWSPDGKELYYCVANVAMKTPQTELNPRIDEVKSRVDEFQYNIERRVFDETTRTFGKPETVVDAAAQGRTALFPRVSPDGRFLAYTMAKSGTFPIWRPEADLYIKDLKTGEERRWDELCSDRTESYHTWDSSGRWLVFSSRREDGQYTRLYFARVDDAGRGSKPFVLPQYEPMHNKRRFKSYNVPEFTVEPIRISERTLIDALKEDSVPTKNL